MKADFKDNFSTQAALYAKYRPDYPDALFSYISSLTKGQSLVWDCGTGNGQAAVKLAKYYKKVVATDASVSQISHAVRLPNIEYKVQVAGPSQFEKNSVDLITAATALHWFNLDLFYPEVKRVLKKDGVIVAWAYGLPTITPEIDKIIHDFHYGELGKFWTAENKMVEDEYRTLPFPFGEIESPEFFSEKEFDLDDLISYLNTWSALQKYIALHKSNPTDKLRESFEKVWPPSKKVKVKWKLTVKAGRNGNF